MPSSYQQVAGMFVLLSQLRAFRGLVKSPEIYASKLTDDSAAAMFFKSEKSVNSLQKMLQDICVPEASTRPSARSNLADQLVNPTCGSSSSTAREEYQLTPSTSVLVNPSSSSLNMPTPSSSNDNSHLMDIILTLQNQLQTMQQATGKESTEEMSDGKGKKPKKPGQGIPPKKGKRIAELQEDEEEGTPKAKLTKKSKPEKDEKEGTPKAKKHSKSISYTNPYSTNLLQDNPTLYLTRNPLRVL